MSMNQSNTREKAGRIKEATQLKRQSKGLKYFPPTEDSFSNLLPPKNAANAFPKRKALAVFQIRKRELEAACAMAFPVVDLGIQ